MDRETWREYKLCRHQARVEGKELAEVLYSAGLLLTRSRAAEIRAHTLRAAAIQLENASATQIMRVYGGTGNSALDMQRGVVAWLRDRADREQV
jgi:hypothetical protein